MGGGQLAMTTFPRAFVESLREYLGDVYATNRSFDRSQRIPAVKPTFIHQTQEAQKSVLRHASYLRVLAEERWSRVDRLLIWEASRTNPALILALGALICLTTTLWYSRSISKSHRLSNGYTNGSARVNKDEKDLGK